MYIERSDRVPEGLDTTTLTGQLDDPDHGMRFRARFLLIAPAEYRQGVEKAVAAQAGVSPNEALKIAIAALAGQGVELIRPRADS